MVKIAEKGNHVTPENSSSKENRSRARKIGPETKYETCQERLTTFGGGLGFIKFLDLFQFKEIFEKLYLPPARKPSLGHYRMVLAILMLLIIGFTRLWHFLYVRLDPMLCAMIGVDKLPHATTFWRYVDSLGINKADPLLKIAAAMRERVWAHCGLTFQTIHIIFVTDQKKKVHKVIEEYDGRADAENLVGEVKREGLSAIPSAKFKNNYAFFFIVMLAYNIWRWMKLVAAMTVSQDEQCESRHPLADITSNTLRIARLVLLLIAAKIVSTANQVKMRYSLFDSRVPAYFDLLKHLDHHRHA